MKYEKKPTHKSNWIKKLLKLGKRPSIELIETCDENNWEEREKFYIKKYKKNLTNTSSGGESPDPSITRKSAIKMWKNPEYRKLHSGDNHHMKLLENRLKISGKNHGMFNKHHSIEAKCKISKALKGHKQTEYQKQRAREANQNPKSETHKRNISMAKSKNLIENLNLIKHKIENENWNYRQVSELLGVSLQSVWRIFNNKLKFQQQ